MICLCVKRINRRAFHDRRLVFDTCWRLKWVKHKTATGQVLDGRLQYVEMGGNLGPVTKSGEQLSFHYAAFRENRLAFVVRLRDMNQV